MDDIPLANNDIWLLLSIFHMSNLGKALFVLGIEIHGIDLVFCLVTQKSYINRVPKKFNMNNCSPRETSIAIIYLSHKDHNVKLERKSTKLFCWEFHVRISLH